jgi:hypothetical protein
MEFVQHIQLIFLPENLSQNKVEEENEKRNQGFAKNFLLWRLIHQSLGQFYFDNSLDTYIA